MENIIFISVDIIILGAQCCIRSTKLTWLFHSKLNLDFPVVLFISTHGANAGITNIPPLAIITDLEVR